MQANSQNTAFIKTQQNDFTFEPIYILSNLPKTPKKGIPKVNRMLFLGHLDDMHGVGLLWKVTLWGLFLNSQNHCKSYWYGVIALWIHKKKNPACIFFVNRSLQIAGRYELENTLGSQNEALPSQISHLINNILENLCFTRLSNFMSRRFQKNNTWETPNDPL